MQRTPKFLRLGVGYGKTCWPASLLSALRASGGNYHQFMKMRNQNKLKSSDNPADQNHAVEGLEVCGSASPSAPDTPLTQAEREDLERHEQTIRAALETTWKAGLALKDIHDRGLYRGKAKTFEQYCWEYWGKKRTTAYQNIESGETYEYLSAVADIPAPTSEFQLRALGGLKPDDQVRVWKEAAKSAVKGKMTAKLITATRIKLGLGKASKPARKPKSGTIDVAAVALTMPVCYGDPESVWANVEDMLDRVRRAWPEGRQTDLHDRLRHYLIMTWPQKYAAAGVAVASADRKAATQA